MHRAYSECRQAWLHDSGSTVVLNKEQIINAKDSEFRRVTLLLPMPPDTVGSKIRKNNESLACLLEKLCTVTEDDSEALVEMRKWTKAQWLQYLEQPGFLFD